MEEYIDIEHVSAEEFNKRYHRHIKNDPVERTERYEAMYYEVEQEEDAVLGDIVTSILLSTLNQSPVS